MRDQEQSLLQRLKKLVSRKLFSGKNQHRETSRTASENISGRRLRTKACPSCGKPILYDPDRKYVPNYCAECSTKYRTERGMITRTCKICGKTFTLPENVQHWPDCCLECKAKEAERRGGRD